MRGAEAEAEGRFDFEIRRGRKHKQQGANL